MRAGRLVGTEKGWMDSWKLSKAATPTQTEIGQLYGVEKALHALIELNRIGELLEPWPEHQ
jgi:hypothetical protein